MKIIFLSLWFICITVCGNAQTSAYENNISNKLVYSLAMDGDILWLGAEGGIVKFNKQTEEFFNYNRFTDSSIQGYFGSRILSLAVNTNGELYAAGDGVIYFNGIDWYRYTNQGAGYITIDHENNTWVGCGDYICKLKNNTWQYYQLNHNPGISNFIISACDFDSENTAWVGTLYHGLFKIENDTVVQIDEFSFGQINSLKVQEDKIFIATRDRGLLEYIPGESKLIKYNTTNSDITGNWVQYAYPDHDSIWLIGGDLMLLKDGDFTFYMDKDSTLFTT